MCVQVVRIHSHLTQVSRTKFFLTLANFVRERVQARSQGGGNEGPPPLEKFCNRSNLWGYDLIIFHNRKILQTFRVIDSPAIFYSDAFQIDLHGFLCSKPQLAWNLFLAILL